MKLTAVLAVLIGILVLACSPAVPAPVEPTPNIDATVEARLALARAAQPTPNPTYVTHELMVVADPPGAARFLLNSKLVDRAQYVSGEPVTIEVLPEAGWEIKEWVGSVYDMSGNTAKVALVPSRKTGT